MTPPIWTRDEIQSPCVQICVVDPQSRLCIGCYRSLDEIRDWSAMAPDARAAIMDELSSRKEKIKPTRRGGRRRTRS